VAGGSRGARGSFAAAIGERHERVCTAGLDSCEFSYGSGD